MKMKRFSIQTALVLALISGLTAVPVQFARAAAPRAWVQLQATLAAVDGLTVDGGWDEDDYQWYRQTVVDIARYDTEPEVRTAANAALDLGTATAVQVFVKSGWSTARTLATQRKTKYRKQVQDWAKTGGVTVKDWANRALATSDFEVSEFVAYGHEIADALDHPATDIEAEQARVRLRVEQMIRLGGPTVIAEGDAALGTDEPAVIAEFYRTGYATANRADFDMRESIRQALETRNNTLDEISSLADIAAQAASARTEILRANIEAMRLLDESLTAMQLGAKASRRADQILEEDKPGRKNGQRGRTAEIEALKVDATTQAQRAVATAVQADSAVALAQTAAAKLIKTGRSFGVDWAKVTVGAGNAIQAAAAGSETAQHAAEATLADSLALDADANAQLHANNADKWLAAAQKQEATAKALANTAKLQQKAAEDAAARAKAQRVIAEAAAKTAGVHAAKTRDARIGAQTASNNAISQSNAAIAAHTDASAAAAAENRAINKANNSKAELQAATDHCIAVAEQYRVITAALQKARDEATAAGQDADLATADLTAAANRAKKAYDAAQSWADQAAVAAATAQSEALLTAVAAKAARAAASKADQDALAARRASDKAFVAMQGSINAAETAKLDAQRTEWEASAAVQEATQAAFQAQIAGQSAAAAAASAELAVGRADTAEWIAAQFAAVNADARRVMQVAAESAQISQDRQDAAEAHATEAAAAAASAAAVASHAVGDVKPAYQAAANAVSSANEAVTAAALSQKAAVDAAKQANGANAAAAQATRYEQTALYDASAAGSASQTASSAAAMAGRASADAERLQNWAVEATASIHTYAQSLIDQLKNINDEKARQDAIAAKQKEFEQNFLKGLLTLEDCQKKGGESCEKVASFLWEKTKQVVAAARDYLLNTNACDRDHNQAACAVKKADIEAMAEFVKQVGIGIWEGVKSFAGGLTMLKDCMSWVVVGTDDRDFLDDCGKAIDQVKAIPKILAEHPFELIHLSEWEKNPGKALGLTLFDVGTFFVPGVGELTGVLSKVVSGLEKLLGRGLTKLSEGAATIGSFTVKVTEGAKLPGAVAKLANVTVKIENGVAKIVDGVAFVDGVVYDLQGVGLKLTGSSDNFVNGAVRLQGGSIKIEGGVAKLENATVKVEKYDGPDLATGCPAAGFAAAVNPLPCGNLPDGSWEGEEFGVKITLNKDFTQAADQAIDLAAKAEPGITATMRSIRDSIEGADLAGLEKVAKQGPSLKRKLAGLYKNAADLSPSAAMSSVHDLVRYTLIFDDARYVTGIEESMAAMKRNGFKLVEFDNKWANTRKAYQGINVTFRKVLEGGAFQDFELQFHTPKSFTVNRAEHIYYEKVRNPNLSLEEREAARLAGAALWGDVLAPDQTLNLTYLPEVG